MNIVAVSLARRFVWTDTDECGRITTMLDKDGEATEDPEQTHAVIAAMPDGKWWMFDPDEFGEETIQ